MADFDAQRNADVIGQALLDTVSSWHVEEVEQHAPGRTLDLDRSVYLVVSNARIRGGQGGRQYQWHSFDLAFPEGIKWRYRSARSLTGADPRHPSECLFDWYPHSGGQLKYYPRAECARFSSPPFQLEPPQITGLGEKAARYYPANWRAAGGTTTSTVDSVASELEARALLLNNEAATALLLKAAAALRKLR